MDVIFLILGLLATIVISVVFILLVIWMVTGYRSRVPFVPVPNSSLARIFSELHLEDNSVVYDLGSGDGRVLFYASRRMPKATYIGIENGTFPLILARARSWWHRMTTDTNVTIINQDFFNHDLSDATQIFCYIYPNVMDDLLPKLEKELKKGTRLVSMSFRFTQKRPISEFDLGKKRWKRARKLYVYEF